MQFAIHMQLLLHLGIRAPNTRIRTALTLSFLAPHNLRAKAKRVAVVRILKDLGERGAGAVSLTSILVQNDDNKKNLTLIFCEMRYQNIGY